MDPWAGLEVCALLLETLIIEDLTWCPGRQGWAGQGHWDVPLLEESHTSDS